jgi:hypothetical protein
LRGISGRLILERMDEAGATGEFDLRFADPDRESDRFDVKRCENKVLCE